MQHHTSLIAMLVFGFVLAFGLGALANRLRLSPLVGYLLAGVLAGPFTPGFVGDAELAPQLAEIGVILLMFGVGLHFSLRDLMSVKNIAIPGAVGQIAMATLLGWGLAELMGWRHIEGLIFGFSLATASTVVLLRAMEERRLLDTRRGKIAVGWLIVEDLACVIALVLIPALAGALGGGDEVGAGDIAKALAITFGKVAAFVAFMLIGMQMRPIWERLADPMRLNYSIVAGAVLLTVILTRIVWVMGFNAARRYAAKHSRHSNPEQSPTVKGGLVVSWCGMRGIVTLAAAFALPDGSGSVPAFPYRDLILFTAFSVVLGTLLIQGLTLRPLIARLRFDDSDPVGREVGRARTIAYRVALAEIDSDPSEIAEVLRLEYTALLSVAGTGGHDGGFVFTGFLSPKTTERQREVQAIAADPRACVLLEAPHRIEALARDLAALGERPLTIGRELTKQFEEVAQVAARDFPAWLQAGAHRTRGEFVLLVHPATAAIDDNMDEATLRTLDLLLAELPVKTAVKLCAEISGAPRNALYQAALARRKGAQED